MSEKREVFVSMKSVHQRFGEQHVLRGVDLDIYRGETLVLLGSSGAGKSVLLKLICGLMCPVEGSVTVDRELISCKNEREMASVRRKVSMMFQGGALFDSLDVAGNIAFPLDSLTRSMPKSVRREEACYHSPSPRRPLLGDCDCSALH